MAGVEDTLSEMIRESPCSVLNRTQALHHVLVVLGGGYEWRDGEVVRRHGRDGRDCRSTHKQFKLPAEHVALLREHGRAVEQQYVDGTCPAEHLRTHAAELARTPGPLEQDPYPASPGAPLFNVPADAAADWVEAAREIAAVVVPLWETPSDYEVAVHASLAPEERAWVDGQRSRALALLERRFGPEVLPAGGS